MTALGEYLRAAATTPAPGAIPCAIFVAEWVVLQGRPDPLEFMRNDTEAQALRRIVTYGPVELARRGMIETLAPEVDEPQAGDVGVIERATDDGTGQVCAIYSGERWVTLCEHGLDAGPAKALVIWRP